MTAITALETENSGSSQRRDDPVCDATVFTKNRGRLLEAEVAKEFLARVVEQARVKGG